VRHDFSATVVANVLSLMEQDEAMGTGTVLKAGPRVSGPCEAGRAVRATVPGMADGHDACAT